MRDHQILYIDWWSLFHLIRGIKVFKKYVILLSLIVLVLTFTIYLNRSEATNTSITTITNQNMKIVAHRGASTLAPENTMAAFQKALDFGAAYIELDVQQSKDDRLVVMHDVALERTAQETGNIGDYTLKQLKKMDVGSFYDASFKGEKIPTLDEVLNQFYGKIGIIIEIKSPQLYPGIEQNLANKLNKIDPSRNFDRIIVQSFDRDSLKQFHQISPNTELGVLLTKEDYPFKPSLLQEVATYATFVNPKEKYVDQDLVDRVHQLNMKIMPWTIDQPATMTKMAKLNVDGMITNVPNQLVVYK